MENRSYTLDQLKRRNLKEKSAQELIDELESEEKKSSEREAERTRRRNEWYEKCVGKCFLIDFNGISFAAYRIGVNPMNTNRMEGVRFFTGSVNDRKVFIEYNKNDPFNRFWLKNPYEDNGIYGTGFVDTKEITEDDFNSIVAKYEKVKEILLK